MPDRVRAYEGPAIAEPVVLVVAAEAGDRGVARAAVTDAAGRATVIDDGAEAVDLVLAARYGARPYDLVLMDLALADVDGFEAARRIRAAGIAARDLPIIAMTARRDRTCLARCRAAGMQDAMPKPVDFAMVHRLIDRWCRDDDADPPPRRRTDRSMAANDGVHAWPASFSSTMTAFPARS